MSTWRGRTPAEAIAEDVSTGDLPEYAELVTLDAMTAAASYIRRNWGDHGYKLGIIRAFRGHGIFIATWLDGLRFYFVGDRYGNCADLTL